METAILSIYDVYIRGLIPAHRFCRSKGLIGQGWLTPLLLICMFDDVADAANYQIKIFFGFAVCPDADQPDRGIG
jgi:hypothetical protein